MKLVEIFLCFFLGGLLVQLSYGEFSCFKKYRRRKDTCGGLIKRRGIPHPEACCGGQGRGFTKLTLDKLGRNQYTCESCKAWEMEQKPLSTPASLTELVCFRKFRKSNGQCGGPMSGRHIVSNVPDCCSGTGSGFSYTGLDKRGKNRYTCISCDYWRQNVNSTTEAPPTTTTEPPDAPREVSIISCTGNTVELMWRPGLDGGSPITHYLVQYNTSENQNNWNYYYEEIKGDARDAYVILQPWATYMFRLLAKNSVGYSKPSKPTKTVCTTPPERPNANPKKVRTLTHKVGKLIITWESMPRLMHSAPGFKYQIFWRRNGIRTYWNKNIVENPSAQMWEVSVNDTYKLYEIKVKSMNEMGESRQPAFNYLGYSGEGEPTVAVKDFRIDPTQPTSTHQAHFIWEAVDTSEDKIKGKFRGYKLRYWKSSEGRLKWKEVDVVISPDEPSRLDVRAALDSLPAHTALRAQVFVMNTHYTGPPSDTIDFTTPEGGTPGEWGAWSRCSESCGRGQQERYRKCENCAPSVNTKEMKACLVHYYCPEAGEWGSWLEWEECSQVCGGGTRQRERLCDNPPPRHGGQHCRGPEREMGSCNEHECRVDGHWGLWTRFGGCTETCGRGVMSRSRVCDKPAPAGGGSICMGPAVDARRCEVRKCPTHGGWTDWSEWSGCSGRCGRGDRSRTRECTRPRPRFGGRDCSGSAEEEESCSHPKPCPVHGGWSPWGEYGRCRAAPCSSGHRLRVRECDSPRPAHRGRMCVGHSVEKVTCYNDDGCRVDGGWCDFGLWSTCSSRCVGQTGTQTRIRACYCPPPENDGIYCHGDAKEVQSCEGFNTCPVS